MKRFVVPLAVAGGMLLALIVAMAMGGPEQFQGW